VAFSSQQFGTSKSRDLMAWWTPMVSSATLNLNAGEAKELEKLITKFQDILGIKNNGYAWTDRFYCHCLCHRLVDSCPLGI
jgi:hypothetical protein